ncbi:hypothetical protein BDZ89DRAFT_1034335 [Hymenopellis radicata]|nr:hypothetical protein BDZ89DRAFT_1034335 [Hymenopellis radicata]
MKTMEVLKLARLTLVNVETPQPLLGECVLEILIGQRTSMEVKITSVPPFPVTMSMDSKKVAPRPIIRLMASSPVSATSSSSAESALLAEMMKLRVTRRVVDYCVNHVLDAVELAIAVGYSPRPFVSMPVVLTAMIYMDRIKTRIHISGDDYMPESLFIGAIIVASKFINDASPKNWQWAACTKTFEIAELAHIEHEFLAALDFDLNVTTSDYTPYRDLLVADVSSSSGLNSSRRVLSHHPTSFSASSRSSSSSSPDDRDTDIDDSPPTTPEEPSVQLRPFSAKHPDLIESFPLPPGYHPISRQASIHFAVELP